MEIPSKRLKPLKYNFQTIWTCFRFAETDSLISYNLSNLTNVRFHFCQRNEEYLPPLNIMLEQVLNYGIAATVQKR